MTQLDRYSRCLNVLENADFVFADNNSIYSRGILTQYDLTFELAWKALQEVLRMHGVDTAAADSPREILQLGYKMGFIDDSAVWLIMLRKRNTSVHIYDENAIDEMILMIRDSFIPAFVTLRHTLQDKLAEVGDDWTES